MGLPTTGWNDAVPSPSNAGGFALDDGYGGATELYKSYGRYAYTDLATYIPFSNPASVGGLGSFGSSSTLTHFHETPDGNVLCMGRNKEGGADQDKFFMFRWIRSTDTFDNSYDPVMKVGSDGTDGVNGTTHLTWVQALGPRNFLNYNDGTNNIILFAEYNSGAQSTPDYQGTIWKSIDDGVTWSVFWRFNNSGVRNFRHCHAVHYNPYNDRILACMGDPGDEACLLQGPRTGDWSAINNTAVGDIETYVNAHAGDWAMLYGEQKYRCIDIAYHLGYMFAYTDASNPATSNPDDRGIIRFAHDLSDTPYQCFIPYHVNSSDTDIASTIGGGMVKDAVSGAMIWMDLITSANSTNQLRVYACRNAHQWYQIGYIGLNGSRSQGTASTRVWQDPQNRIWLGGSYQSYNDDGSNEIPIITLSGTFSGSPVRLNEGAPA